MKKRLDTNEYKLLETILKSTQEELREGMVEILKTFFDEERMVINDSFIMAIGNTSIGLIAHLDTVHSEVPHELYYDRKKGVLWSPQGIGADDRAGVYSIIELLKRGCRPTVILTTDEEIGGVGASSLVDQLKDNPCELKYLIELDRRGHLDSVFYDCANQEFEEYVNSFNFKTNYGSFSDISIIAPAWGLSAVNLSIGYHNEHTKQEILNVDQMYDTIDKVENMLDDEKNIDTFKFVEKNISREFNNGISWDIANSGELCWHCLRTKPLGEIITTDTKHQYCVDCYNALYSQCISCRKEFRDEKKLHLCCPECRK